MRLFKKTLSLFLVLIMFITLANVSIIPSAAVTKFTDGDFEYAKTSDDIIEVCAYLGDKTEIRLPSSVNGSRVTGVYADCFKESNITSVRLPDSYKSIGSLAFCNCKELTSIVMPASLESVGTMAFYGCENLVSVDFTYVCFLKSLSFAVFSNCNNLTSIDLPECVKTISDNAFANCSSLKSVSMSDDITKIPEYAFYGCSFEKFSLPSHVTSIEEGAFANNTSLNSIEFPLTLTTIGNSAFKGDASLVELFIPDSVTSIGAEAFAPMSYSKTINVTCYENSYAAEYCYNNRVENLTTIEKLIGDADLNGEVNILDVTCIQRYKIGEDTISTYRAEELADVNKDGNITIRDATLIQMYLAKIITEF